MPDLTITLDQAKAWAKSWRNNPPKDLAKGHLITGQALTELLGAEGVVDVRAYMGVDEQGTQKLMLVGVNSAGNNMIDAGHLIYDHTMPCPSSCDTSSPLFNP